MKVKLCMASAVLRFYPIELAIEKIAEAGYDALELWGGQYHGYYQDFLAAGSNLEERRLDHEKTGEVKSMAEDHALDIVMYTPEQVFYPINYLARDVAPFDGEKERNKSINYFKLGEDLVHVHIDDNFGETDDHLMPGDGNIDFKPFAKALKGSGYKGYVSAEISIFGNYPISPEPERLTKRSRRFVLSYVRFILSSLFRD